LRRESLTINYAIAQNASECSMSERALLQAADRASKNSHAPYSKFRVGAALLLEDSSVIEGSNQENVSFPVGLCAERTALAAKASIAPKKKIVAIAIRVKSELRKINEPGTPCGICRQVLLEQENIQKSNIKVIMQGETGHILIFNSVKDLMPFYFNGNIL